MKSFNYSKIEKALIVITLLTIIYVQNYFLIVATLKLLILMNNLIYEK